jgi:hypothetical protein
LPASLSIAQGSAGASLIATKACPFSPSGREPREALCSVLNVVVSYCLQVGLRRAEKA